MIVRHTATERAPAPRYSKLKGLIWWGAFFVPHPRREEAGKTKKPIPFDKRDSGS